MSYFINTILKKATPGTTSIGIRARGTGRAIVVVRSRVFQFVYNKQGRSLSKKASMNISLEYNAYV